MDSLASILASIREDDNAIIEIKAFADGGEDDSTRGNTGEDDGINIVGSEDAAEASVGEHAETSFGQNGVVSLDVKRGVELGSISSDDHAVVGLDLGEGLDEAGNDEDRKA